MYFIRAAPSNRHDEGVADGGSVDGADNDTATRRSRARTPIVLARFEHVRSGLRKRDKEVAVCS